MISSSKMPGFLKLKTKKTTTGPKIVTLEERLSKKELYIRSLDFYSHKQAENDQRLRRT